MANGNPFSGLGEALRRGAVGFGAGLAGGSTGAALIENLFAQQARDRQTEALNPFRQAVQEQLLGPRNVFAGGPASEFSAPQATPFGGLAGGPQPAQQLQQPAPAQQPFAPQQPGGPQAAAEPPKPLPPGLPPNLSPPPEIDSALQQAASRFGVPVNALRAIASNESGDFGFQPDIVGRTEIDLPGQEGDRAVGFLQFSPQTTAEIRRTRNPQFDPTNPQDAADETARMLRASLDRGNPIDIAMMEHFSGPNPELQGERSQAYRQTAAGKFQLLEQATAATQPGPALQPVPDVAAQAGPSQAQGPFGTVVNQPQGQQPGQQDFGRRVLELATQDPAVFAQMFAGKGGIDQIIALLQGGDVESQTRVVSGDTPEGRQIGLRAGERARVKGRTTPGGKFFPTEVVAKPFERPGGETGGQLVNLFDLDKGEVITRRRDDPEVDARIQQGAVVVPDGAALQQFEQMSQGERKALTDAQVSTKQFLASVGDALDLLQEQPDLNTFVARGAALVNDLRQEAKAAAGALGVDFDESIFDVSTHEETFRNLGIQNERMKSLITSMAFQRAAAESGVGRVTNRMMERFIEEVGGGAADPVSLAAVLQDIAQRTARSFEINFETRTGAPFQGDLGLEQLPRLSPEDLQRQTFPGRGGETDTAAGQLPPGIPEGSQPLDRTTRDGEPVFQAPDGSLWVP